MSSTLAQQPNEAKITFPSDNLRPIYELCKKHPTLVELFGMRPQIRLVIDTNIVFDELLFVTKKRRKNSARTALREVLDSGLVVTIAPTKMHEEVNRHIPRIAHERVVPEETLRQAWLELQARIEFHDVGESALLGQNVADPDDVPFVVLYLTSGADAVLTRDKDISVMGAKTLGHEALLNVRDYARAKSPEVALRVGGVLVVGVPIGGLVALVKLLGAALRGFRNLRPELQLLLIGGAVFAALHPATRKALSAAFSSVATGLKSSAGLFGEALGELSLKICATQVELKAKEAVVEGVIPRSPLAPSAFLTQSVNEEGKERTFDLIQPLQITQQRQAVPARRKRVRKTSIRLKVTARHKLGNEQDSTPTLTLCKLDSSN